MLRLLLLPLFVLCTSLCQAETRLHVAADIYTQVSATKQVGDASKAEALLAELPALLAEEQVSEAIRLATDVLVLDPNNATARRLLGYQRVSSPAGTEHWCGGYAALMLERGNVWHQDFGWVKAEDVSRWEAGERPWGKKWITKEEDAERHATIKRGWTVRTDHFHITTNHSRASSIELAIRLETLHQIWRQLFGEFDVSARELQARLDGKQPTGYRRKPFRVIYHATRDEYNAALRRRQQQIEMTLGIYFDRERELHFFAGEDQDAGTIYHEAVHQFFFESKKANKQFARLANAWAVEGVACYFESLMRGGRQEARSETSPRATSGAEGLGNATNSFSLGSPDAGRLPAAQHRRLVDKYYVPLRELSALGMVDLQSRKDLPQLYSQSAGLATFFLEYEEGKYRPVFRELLASIYAGRDEPNTLERVAGVSFETLDREYGEFLATLASEPE
ncbi:MAG: hypothetical protein RH917_00025 [Lacipirellulaceae bacterium]